MPEKVAVLGSGSWGTALAIHLSRVGFEPTICARNLDTINEINNEHQNRSYLHGIAIPEIIKATANLADALVDTQMIIIALPAQTIKEFVSNVESELFKNKLVLIAAKGIDALSLEFLSEIVASKLKTSVGVISGPNYAFEVALGLPARTVIASANLHEAQKYSELMTNHNFKCEYSNDLRGVELLGAVKNVLAIGCGIVRGLEIGDNAVASFFNNGINEIRLLLEHFGGKADTMFSAAGMGDLILSCTSFKLRNHNLGIELGSNKIQVEEILSRPQLVEGFKTTFSLKKLLDQKDISLPIFNLIYQVLSGEEPIDAFRSANIWL
ncbi:NAD(P)H-dependent glycerol-3-phosphate dehydrogenase [Rickettsiales endosymbiont of Stachyamoeba lipophora]|uniref:NAD(P)H-dependent glycerol-3-phosphate dehydrogenase n=1 Tax=Rickettsiales endosymbiont of Stachyamoeba lipophora TaxID=2486578 RepID=UPI000F64A003|nr:NAD(P)H-dependent glycerol-3-phosphate dehydrogenase [Rickettsiales endosymbiont of Stachyamoeba lipophora]AZL15573.1 NAD(P)H-dependent glycerol-3-phosphate dehydrogenase [Rickettsiales endosymbiont of Stachyamoeba lipophora]